MVEEYLVAPGRCRRLSCTRHTSGEREVGKRGRELKEMLAWGPRPGSRKPGVAGVIWTNSVSSLTSTGLHIPKSSVNSDHH